LQGDEVLGPSGRPFRLSQGARAEIDRLVGTKLNDRAALNSVLKGESDWNYDRLSTLFGRDRVDELYRVLDNERAMAETEDMALANSKTAGVQAAQQEINGPATRQKGAMRSAMNFDFGDAFAGVADKLTGGYAQRRRDAINEDIAEALMGRGDLSPTSIQGRRLPEVNLPMGALIDTIMQSASPRPATTAGATAPMSDDEFMRLVMSGRGA
jgi:hypothetical protein